MADEGFFNLLPDASTDIEAEEMPQPSKTYGFDLEAKTIGGSVDGKDAVLQAMLLRLMTDAGIYEIYSSNYGLSVNNLMGLPFLIVRNELERRITETLLHDNRVKEVTNFDINQSEDTVNMRFTINTVYGISTVERGFSL